MFVLLWNDQLISGWDAAGSAPALGDEESTRRATKKNPLQFIVLRFITRTAPGSWTRFCKKN
jgi:hypothetical protein